MATGAVTIKRFAVRLLAAGLLAWAPLSAAEGGSPVSDQDRMIFKTLYGEKLSTVDRTRNGADDITLAGEMMAFASDLPAADAGVQCLIYIDAVRLASNGADLGLMKEASGLLNSRWPGQDAVSPEELMQLASRAYRSVERNDRAEQGEHYIDLLLQIVDRYVKENDPEQAIGVCRLASTIARTIGSDQLKPIEARLKRLDAANDTAKRIKMLTLSVEKNPQNSPAARELIRMLIIHHNDPKTALKYVESTKDEELIDLVRRCAKGIGRSNAATALRVGDWYVILAEDQDDDPAVALLGTARKWYARFFAEYRRDDALAKRVRMMDRMAASRIERLSAGNPGPAGDGDPEENQWLSLTTPPYDVRDYLALRPDFLDTAGGQITIDDGQFAIPLKPGSAYEVRITLTVHDPEQYEKRGITVVLPVGEKHTITTRYMAKGGTIATIDHVSEKTLIDDAPDRVGGKVQLTLQVSQTETQMAYAVLFNGKPAASWKGITEHLEETDKDDFRRLPKDLGTAVLIRSLTKVTLHAVEYRER